MKESTDLTPRLDSLEQRLRDQSNRTMAGLTEPDEGGTERWEAGQVWAHIAEFVPYWHDQARKVVEAFTGTPVPFGRSKTDAIRTDPIEANRNVPINEQMSRTHEAIAALRTYLAGLTAADWAAVGQHPVRGPMDVGRIVSTFIADHLEEHADQLDGLHAA